MALLRGMTAGTPPISQASATHPRPRQDGMNGDNPARISSDVNLDQGLADQDAEQISRDGMPVVPPGALR